LAQVDFARACAAEKAWPQAREHLRQALAARTKRPRGACGGGGANPLRDSPGRHRAGACGAVKLPPPSTSLHCRLIRNSAPAHQAAMAASLQRPGEDRRSSWCCKPGSSAASCGLSPPQRSQPIISVINRWARCSMCTTGHPMGLLHRDLPLLLLGRGPAIRPGHSDDIRTPSRLPALAVVAHVHDGGIGPEPMRLPGQHVGVSAIGAMAFAARGVNRRPTAGDLLGPVNAANLGRWGTSGSSPDSSGRFPR